MSFQDLCETRDQVRRSPRSKLAKVKKDLIKEISQKRGITKSGLKVTLSRIKKRKDLKSIDQAACFYIKKNNVDINVSSIIDDVTRQVLLADKTYNSRNATVATPIQTKNKQPQILVPKIRWIKPNYYSLASKLGDFYPYLFIFENALRSKIDYIMSKKYSNWWETKIKNDLPDTYKYVDSEKKKQSKLPMIGNSSVMGNLDFLTLGQLEQIIIKYQKEFVPAIFPNLDFFTGHMIIIKRVRNSIAHMAPCVLPKDIKYAKNEIEILLHHLSNLP